MFNRGWKRSHHCGQLRRENVGQDVTLNGWVANHRDMGGVIFIDLRDRWGMTQVVFHPEEDADLCSQAARLKMESVIGIHGKVTTRPDTMVNPGMDTGEIEVKVSDLVVFNESKPLPFLIKDDIEISEELRFKHRYLDIRRPSMQRNLLLRHGTYQTTRQYFDELGFIEVETPILMKSTPEGARDYLVPSRIHRGKFYALPQSPQTYKQLLMVSGYDRYFQIVRCFRDEDLRADRQPEFTQIDVEMSFVDEEDIIEVVEGLIVRLFQELLDVTIDRPFPRFNYQSALARFGTDAPDIRFGMEIVDVSDLVSDSGFRVFDETVRNSGRVRGICQKGAGPISRKQVDQLTDFVHDFGAKGLVVIQMKDDEIATPIAKFVSDTLLEVVCKQFNAAIGDAIFLIADADNVCCSALSNLRKLLAANAGLIDSEVFKPLWVLDFPLLEWDEEHGRFAAMHHPFTSPKAEDIELLDSDPGRVRARAYDLVINGSEIAGGSIRNHRRDVQEMMFRALGLDREKAEQKFGFLMDALEYGAPPHGGIAFGFDRLVSILAGEQSIREVIAFPKTTSALSLMDGSPSEVDIEQLKELGLQIRSEES